jgi:hypothetical protein
MPNVTDAVESLVADRLSGLDTAGLRLQIHSQWPQNPVIVREIEALCSRSSDPFQFHFLPLHHAFNAMDSGAELTVESLVWRMLLVYSVVQLEAVLFLQEATLLGVPTGYFRGHNAKGEILIVAESGKEENWLAAALKLLLQRHRAFLVLLDRQTPGPATLALSGAFHLRSDSIDQFWELPLAETFDTTLATMGRRTRRNLRHALRQVEQNGWQFHPALSMNELSMALHELRSCSTRPTSEITAERRLRYAAGIPNPMAMGLRDAEGRWLSCIAGSTTANATNVIWQENCAGYPQDSLCTIMRALLLRHEIERGAHLIRFIGGTNALQEHLCKPSESRRLWLGRPGMRLGLLRRLPQSSLMQASKTLGSDLIRLSAAK